MQLMNFSISSKGNVSASQATFFEMLSAWSASFLADMTRISRGMNHQHHTQGDLARGESGGEAHWNQGPCTS